jgi:hypothetical protein
MALCCSALTISDYEAAQRWGYYAPSAGSLGLNIGTLLSMSIGLVLGGVLKKLYRWEPENIHRRFNSESHPPVERHGLAKGMVRLRSTGSFHQKECFDFFCDFYASV